MVLLKNNLKIRTEGKSSRQIIEKNHTGKNKAIQLPQNWRNAYIWCEKLQHKVTWCDFILFQPNEFGILRPKVRRGLTSSWIHFRSLNAVTWRDLQGHLIQFPIECQESAHRAHKCFYLLKSTGHSKSLCSYTKQICCLQNPELHKLQKVLLSST